MPHDNQSGSNTELYDTIKVSLPLVGGVLLTSVGALAGDGFSSITGAVLIIVGAIVLTKHMRAQKQDDHDGYI